MEVFKDSYNTIAGVIISVFTLIFGRYWFLFGAFLALNIIDWITGWIKARKTQTESSTTGLKGIVKKFLYWLLIAVSFLVGVVFIEMGGTIGVDLSIMNGIGYFVLASLMVNEARSVIENLVECGVNVPKVLIKELAIAHKLVNKDDESEGEE